MEILSKDTLTLLRNADVRKALEEALNDNRESSTRVVTVQRERDLDRPDAHQESTEITVRRIA
jgi:hypothetical protein